MNKFNFKEVFYLSNLLSISRIILTLPAIYLIKLNTKSGNIVLLGLGLLLILTDHLDGYFSRKFNQETLLGQLLDPIADKISMGIILLFLLIYRDFPMQLVILIVYRDLLIILIGLFLVRKKNADLRANFYGKLNTGILALTIIVFLLNINNQIFQIFIGFSYVSLAISGIVNFLMGEKYINYRNNLYKYIFRFTILFITFAVCFCIFETI